MLELFSLHDKVAVITGASRGLGRPMAKGLAAAFPGTSPMVRRGGTPLPQP